MTVESAATELGTTSTQHGAIPAPRTGGSAGSGGGVAVEIAGVTKRYGARKRRAELGPAAIENVDITVAPGEFLGIVGPSGCGKSTLLLMIAGLVRPTEGEITVAGKRVEGPHSDLGFVFQSAVLLEWRTVLENVLLQGVIRKERSKEFKARAIALLASVGLEKWMHHYPHQLSGGMRQRVAICRALVHEPQLLLMDEPFGALDSFTRDQLNVDVQKMWRRTGCTTVFVTHSISEAVFLSDRILVLAPHPGRVLETVEVKIPRPRRIADRSSPEFAGYVDEIERRFASIGVLNEED